MNCQDAAFWRGYLDYDSPIDKQDRSAAEEHLAGCANCRKAIDDIRADRERVGGLFAADAGQAAAAWQRFAAVTAGAGEVRARRWSWPSAVGVTVGVVLIATVLTPPMRGVAEDLLQLFRAEKFEAISIDPQAIANFDPSVLGKFEWDEPRHEVANSISHASSLTGLTVAEPGNLPAGVSRSIINASTAGKVSLTFDVEKFVAYMSNNNIEGINLPPSLDGKTMVGRIPPMVMMEYGPGGDVNHAQGQPYLVVGQAGLPTVEAPPGVDFKAVRDELLKLPVFPMDVRERLMNLTDWKRTLPIPIPAPDEVRHEKVLVDGAYDGLYFEEARSGTRVLIWTAKDQAHGVVAPAGPSGPQLSRVDLFAVAASLQ